MRHHNVSKIPERKELVVVQLNIEAEWFVSIRLAAELDDDGDGEAGYSMSFEAHLCSSREAEIHRRDGGCGAWMGVGCPSRLTTTCMNMSDINR